jgi:hypothetical protein
MGFATSRAGQSLHRLQINMLLQFGQEGTLIERKIITSTAKQPSSAVRAGRNAIFLPSASPGRWLQYEFGMSKSQIL